MHDLAAVLRDVAVGRFPEPDGSITVAPSPGGSADALLAPPAEALWAQVAPGNAASLRAVVAAGYVAVGAEVLFPRIASPHG